MPSPFIHIGYALGFGTLIMLSTKGSFTVMHCLILALNGFVGPDIGAFIGWCFEITFPILADKAMSWIHHSIGYILIMAPLISFLSSRLSRKIVNWKYTKSLSTELSNVNIEQTSKNIVSLNMKECYLLAIAGCLLHFQLDHIFEEDGQDKFYRWILSTGYFKKPMLPLSSLSVIFVGLSTFALFFGFAWIHVFSSSLSKQSLKTRLKNTLALFVLVFSLYFIFLIISIIILKKKAVVGEEADLGVLVFIIDFHFLPFILCLLSIHN
ncbi:unnamed protein product [Rotaria sp. Silwood1]|nr:unnamed protein product [Rotaria sp. Silwood1]